MQTAAPFVLRTSHHAILAALNKHSVLSPSQLTRLLWKKGSLTYAYEQLRMLSHQGYAAPFVVMPTRPGARARLLYGLGSRGRKHLRRLGIPLVTRYRPCEDRE